MMNKENRGKYKRKKWAIKKRDEHEERKKHQQWQKRQSTRQTMSFPGQQESIWSKLMRFLVWQHVPIFHAKHNTSSDRHMHICTYYTQREKVACMYSLTILTNIFWHGSENEVKRGLTFYMPYEKPFIS